MELWSAPREYKRLWFKESSLVLEIDRVCYLPFSSFATGDKIVSLRGIQGVSVQELLTRARIDVKSHQPLIQLTLTMLRAAKFILDTEARTGFTASLGIFLLESPSSKPQIHYGDHVTSKDTDSYKTFRAHPGIEPRNTHTRRKYHTTTPMNWLQKRDNSEQVENLP